jgi:hypothetical protein
MNDGGLQKMGGVDQIPTVFVSYAWADTPAALAIDQWLRNRNARVLIDRRDFIPGNDIEAEIVRCLKDAGKVICIFSGHSANRPYPELERRITTALERTARSDSAQTTRRLIYFSCIDDTPLPLEALPRLAIKAERLDFESACNELWRSIVGEAAPPVTLDVSQFADVPPWSRKHTDLFDIGQHPDALERFYKNTKSRPKQGA